MAAREDDQLLDVDAQAELGDQRPTVWGSLRARHLVPFCAAAGMALFAFHSATRSGHTEMREAASDLIDLSEQTWKLEQESEKYRVVVDDCEERWHNMACNDDECKTCGDRIKHAENAEKKGWMQAVYEVATNFSDECKTQRYNIACKNGTCRSCGDRMKELVKKFGFTITEAHENVSTEFKTRPGTDHGECQACSSAIDTCLQDWENDACFTDPSTLKRECYTCGQRITFAQKKYQLGRSQAGGLVAGEFPDDCRKCAPESQGQYGNYEAATPMKFETAADFVPGEKWERRVAAPVPGSQEKQYYTDEETNSKVNDTTKVLEIRAKREGYKGLDFTSSEVRSVKSWKYGKFTAKISVKGVLAKGALPYFRMLPESQKRDGSGSYGDWPKSGGIDIMEHTGVNKNTFFQTAHTQDFFKSEGDGPTTVMNADEFHEFWLEWKPDMITIGVDKKTAMALPRLSRTDKDKWPFDKPMFVALGISVGGKWAGAEGVDSHAFDDNGQVLQIKDVTVKQQDWMKQLPEQEDWQTHKAGCYFKLIPASVDKLNTECGKRKTTWQILDATKEKHGGADVVKRAAANVANCLSTHNEFLRNCGVEAADTKWKFVAPK